MASTTPHPDPAIVASPSSEPTPTPRWTSLGAAIGIGSVVALLGWVAVNRGYGTIPWPAMSEAYLKEAEAKYADLSQLSAEAMAEYNTKEQAFLHRNAAFVIGLVGLLMGTAFGALAGRERRCSIIGSGIIGGVLGTVFGAVGGYAAATVARIAARFKFEPMNAAEMNQVWLREMYTSIAIHAAIWCIVGIGLAIIVVRLGNPSRTWGRSIGMAIGAGLVAAALYTPLASVIVPKIPSGLTIPADPAVRDKPELSDKQGELAFARLVFVVLPVAAMSVMVLAHHESKRRPAEALSTGS